MQIKIRQATVVILSVAALLGLGGCSDETTDSRERLMALSPRQLEFTTWAGENPNPAQQKVTVTFENRPSTAWTAATDCDWLRIGARGTDTVFVIVISTDVQAGVHRDSIAVDIANATNGPRYIVVELTVLNQVDLTPSSLTFATLAGGAALPPQELIVANFGIGSATYTAETAATWLILESGSGAMPDTIDVSVDITGLNAGYYLDSIIVNSPELPKARAVVYVQLSLSSWASVGLGRIDIALEDVHFVNQQSGWASGWAPSSSDPHGHVFRSDDEGETWQNVLNIPDSTIFGGLAALSAERCFVVGDMAEMYVTNDSGRHWSHVVGLPVSSAIVLRDICFADCAHGWAIGSAGTILGSTDSGATWTKQTVPTSQDLTGMSFLDTQTGWVSGNHGTLLHTGDGGTTWVAQSSGTSSDLRAITFVDNLHGWTGGADGIVLRTTDGGANWEALLNVGDVLILDVIFVNEFKGWVVGIDGSIFRTDDGGDHWVEQTSGTTQMLTEIFFLDDNLGWVVGSAGTVIRTANGGF